MKDFSEVAKNGAGHNDENMEIDKVHAAVVSTAKKNVENGEARRE